MAEINVPIVIENEAQAKQALKNVSNSLKQLNSELKTVSSSYDKNKKSIDDYAKEQEKLKKIIDEQKKKVDILKQAYEKSAKTAGENADKTTDWKLKLEAAQRSLQNYEKKLENSINQMEALNKKTKEATENTQKLSKAQELSNSAKSLENIGSKASVVSLPAAAGLAAATTTTASFEKSMSNVQAISQATSEDIEKLTEKAKEMGASTSKSASESADALGYMALAGWNTEQMLNGLEPILRASEAGTMDLATCSDLVTDSMSAMGIQVQDLGGYLDIVTQAQNNSNTSMQDLLTAYVECGGTLKNLNIPLEESATLLGTLANRGIKGAEAGTSFNSLLVNLIGASSSAATALDNLGVSAWNSDGSFKGVAETLNILQDALNNCTEEQKNMFIAAIGGKTQMDTLQALLSGVGEEYDELNAKINDCSGTMEATALIMQDNLAGDTTTLISQLEAVGVTMGELVTPQIRELAQNLTKGLKAFNDMDEGTQRLITSTVVFAAAIGPVLTVTGKIGGAVSGAISTVSTFVGAINSGKTAMEAFNLVCDANPIMLLVSALSIAVTAFVAFKAAADDSKSVYDEMKEKADSVTESIKNQKEATDNLKESTEISVQAEQEKLNAVEKLLPKFDELSTKTKRSKEEEDELRGIIGKLNEAMPDLKLAIDEETGAVNMNTHALKDNIQAYKDLAAAKGAKTLLENATKNKLELEYKAKASGIDIEEFNKLEKKYTDLKREAMKDEKVGKLSSAWWQDFHKVEAEYKAKQDAAVAVRKSIKDAEAEVKFYSETYDNLTKSANEVISKTEAENSKKITKVSQSSKLSDAVKSGIKNWEYKYQAGTISEQKYLDELTRIRDAYFVKDSEGWNEYNAKIASIKNKANKTALSEDKKAATEAQKQAEKEAKELAKAKEEAEKQLKEQNEKEFESHLQASFDWIDAQEFRDTWEEIQDTMADACDRMTAYIKENGQKLGIEQDKINENLKKVSELKKQALISDFEDGMQELEDFISDRDFFMDWDKFNVNETDIINQEQKLLDKYYNSGLLSKKEYIAKCKELNRQLYTANKEQEESLVAEVTKKWDRILSDKQTQIQAVTERLNSRISDLEDNWDKEDRQENLEELKRQANLYKNAVTSAGQEQYESVRAQIKQLEREEERARLEEENNKIIAQMEAEYKELEQKKAEELDSFNKLTLAQQQLTNDLLGEIAEKLGSENIEDIKNNVLSEANLSKIANGEEFKVFDDLSKLNDLKSIQPIQAPEIQDLNKNLLQNSMDLSSLAAATNNLTNVTKNVTNVVNNTDNSSRTLNNTQYVKDNVDMNIFTKSLSTLFN